MSRYLIFLLLIPDAAAWISSNSRIFVGDTRISAISYYYHRSDKPEMVFLALHDSEDTCFLLARDIIRKAGGRILKLNNVRQRCLQINYKGKDYLADPNRIFTITGVTNTLLRYNSSYPEALEQKLLDFSTHLVNKYLALNAWTLVSLHNNTKGRYSIVSYAPQGDEAANAAAVHINKNMDPDDFFFVTEREHYDHLKSKDYNTVLQDNKAVQDDGSLSVYCGKKGIPYINIEAGHSNFASQEKMIREVYRMYGEFKKIVFRKDTGNHSHLDGRTFIFYAAKNGLHRTVARLLDAGIDVNITSRNGNTPLMTAAYFGQARTVKTLLDWGANPCKTNVHGRTALMLAELRKHPEAAAVLKHRLAAP